MRCSLNIFKTLFLLCVFGCMGDVLSLRYRLVGEIKSFEDSTVLESVTVVRHYQSNELSLYGKTSFDTVFQSDSGVYFIGLRARVSDDDAERVLNSAIFSFKFQKAGFASIETTFAGNSLPRKRSSREFEVELPDIYLRKLLETR